MTKKNEVAVIEEGAFPVLAGDVSSITEALEENFEGEQLSQGILAQLRVPGGGGTVWELEDADPAKTFTGIIIAKKKQKAWWEKSFDEGGSEAPDCVSHDGKTGIYTYTDDAGEVQVEKRDCTTCPKNQFGSAEKGSGKACSDNEFLFILMEGEFLPTVLKVPPSSLLNSTLYKRKLASKGRPYWAVVTEFSLHPEKSDDGIKYSQIDFKMVAALTEEQKAKVKAYKEAFSPVVSGYTDTEPAE